MAEAAFGVSEDLPELTVDKWQGAVRGQKRDKGRQHVQQGKESLALFFDYGFRFFARGDVKEYTADIIHLTGGIAEYLPPGLNPGNLPVLFPDAVFPDVNMVGLEGFNKFFVDLI